MNLLANKINGSKTVLCADSLKFMDTNIEYIPHAEWARSKYVIP